MDFGGTERFEVVRCLGSGGMGVVYEVFDRERGLRRALKVLHHQDASSVIQLKQEFRSLRDLSHPNLVALDELVEEGGQWFFTMELVDGVDFARHVGTAAAAASGPTAFPEATKRVELEAPQSSNATASLGMLQPADRGPPVFIPALREMTERQFDELRLRAALTQVARGLVALHSAGKVHRDIKPSNVLVTAEQRAVILDFGLVTDLSHATRSLVMGTPAFMSPEQARALPVASSSDWYSVGVLVFQALTGQLPARADLRLRLGEIALPFRRPADFCVGIPPDLDRLCTELLRLDPLTRPTGPEVLERLGNLEERVRHRQRTVRRRGAFTGRVAELAQLRDAFARARQGQGSTVIVQGESGLGKSELVARFVELTAAEHPELLVLDGRSHARESVPFRALDGVIDGLMISAPTETREALAALDEEERERVGAAFPVLGQSAQARPLTSGADGIAQRRQLFLAMRKVLGAVASTRPLLVTLDDLQWADADSLALLQELLRPPRAPFMVVATVRTQDPAPWLPLHPEALGPNVRHVLLQPLSPDDARSLAGELLLEGNLSSAAVSQLALEANGHPLFLQELIRNLPTRDRPGLKLEEVLRERVRTLEPVPRRFLGLVALAGTTLENAVLRAALGEPPETFARTLSLLQNEQLVRPSGLRRGDHLEPFHDRIRESTLLELTPAEAHGLHHALAVSLEAAGSSDLAALSLHWQESGDLPRARLAAAGAAAAAEQTLAFDRAVTLLRRCLELLPPSSGRDPERVALWSRLGNALVSLGRGEEAAAAYLAGVPFADAYESVELQRLGGERLLYCGRHDEGLAALQAAVEASGLKWPSSKVSQIGGILWDRLMQNRGARKRTLRPFDKLELQRADLCWAVCSGMPWADALLAASFGARYSRMVAGCEDGNRRLLALASDYPFTVAEDRKETPRSRALLAAARALGETLPPGESTGVLDFCDAMGHLFLLEDMPRAAALSEKAEARLMSVGRSTYWELGSARFIRNSALYVLGSWAELRQRVQAQMADALARGDRPAVAHLSCGAPWMAFLAADQVADARRVHREAVERYPRGRRLLHVPLRMGDAFSSVTTALYVGDTEEAMHHASRFWQTAGGSLFIRTPFLVFTADDAIGRATLARACVSTGKARAGLISELSRLPKKLRAFDNGPTRATSVFFEAGVAALQGSESEALRLLERAETLAAEAPMAMFAAAIRVQRGRYLGGTAGEALSAGALAWMSEQVVKPELITATIAPFPGR